MLPGDIEMLASRSRGAPLLLTNLYGEPAAGKVIFPEVLLMSKEVIFVRSALVVFVRVKLVERGGGQP